MALTSMRPITTFASCERTSSESVRSMVRLTSAGSLNAVSPYKN
jgi:hypothetical protein